jgi:hypothetical protein
MILHVILFRPRPDLTDSERKAVLDAMIAAARHAPTVRACRLGRRVTHGLPGYEQAMREDYEYAAIIEFDDVQGLREYLRHPAHSAAGAHFSSAAASALAYDYQMAELGAGSDVNTLLT